MPDLPFRRIAIAGGSQGIGAALALTLAAPGRQLHLCARAAGPLAESAAACRARGAEVRVQPCDLTRPGAGARWLAEVAAATGAPPDLVIVAAGIFGGRPEGATETPEAVSRAVIAATLTGPLTLTEAAAAQMRRAGAGQIVLLGSLAARDPLPDARAYSASKAGLACYARALRADLAGSGVGVLLVEPGHVATRQTAQHQGPLPLLLSPEAAAARILAALARGRDHLAFPRRAVWALAVLNALPPGWRAALLRDQRFSVQNLPEPGAPQAGQGRR
ncbi:SDR family NAD(P)-dependent oxidoreductase [Pseudooceanicola sp. 200-1SW]|uniref:SDR family NAD(P)-dependent oxidoreductase n=1 Tax=Pseudooceanicola sp. 200-1SW TaxID=3425949 RepID=UPI003D7F43AB